MFPNFYIQIFILLLLLLLVLLSDNSLLEISTVRFTFARSELYLWESEFICVRIVCFQKTNTKKTSANI